MALLSSRFYEILLKPEHPNTIDALRAAQNWLKTCHTNELSEVLGQRLLTNESIPYSSDFFWGALTLGGCWA